MENRRQEARTPLGPLNTGMISARQHNAALNRAKFATKSYTVAVSRVDLSVLTLSCGAPSRARAANVLHLCY